MINYMLLVSRQGVLAYRTRSAGNLTQERDREGPPLEMVHHDVAEGEGEDRQGRHAARPRAADAHV